MSPMLVTPRRNVGSLERGLSLAGGGLALAGFLRHPTARTAPLAGLAAALLLRGASGWCPVNALLGRDSRDGDRVSAADAVSDRTWRPRREAERQRAELLRAAAAGPRVVPSHDEPPLDIVQEASEESFPASDPPSFTPGKIGP